MRRSRVGDSMVARYGPSRIINRLVTASHAPRRVHRPPARADAVVPGATPPTGASSTRRVSCSPDAVHAELADRARRRPRRRREGRHLSALGLEGGARPGAARRARRRRTSRSTKTGDTREELLAAVVNPMRAVTDTSVRAGDPVPCSRRSPRTRRSAIRSGRRVVQARRNEIARVITRGIRRGGDPAAGCRRGPSPPSCSWGLSTSV